MATAALVMQGTYERPGTKSQFYILQLGDIVALEDGKEGSITHTPQVGMAAVAAQEVVCLGAIYAAAILTMLRAMIGFIVMLFFGPGDYVSRGCM